MKKTILFALGLLALAPLAAQQTLLHSSNLPIVIIDTQGQEILSDPKIDAHMGVIWNPDGQRNNVTDPFNHYDGHIGIELRGSSSFYYEKRPYRIELRDDDGEDLDFPLLGLPAESDWALIAPLNDKTLMRDVITHLFAREVLPWSPRTQYCEVILNGDYIGVYILIETIKRTAERLNLAKLAAKDTLGDDLTGGYILRIDKYGPPPGGTGGDWQSKHPLIPGTNWYVWYQYYYPEAEEIRPAQAAYIQDFMVRFDDMMAGPNYKSDYPQWIDTDTWLHYLLVQEIGKNIDGYRLSTYFYKDKNSNDGRLKMGPVWDFNIAYGIGDYCEAESWAGWQKDFNVVCQSPVHFWWDRLWADDAFRVRMGARWKEMRQGSWSNTAVFETIDSIAAVLQESQQRNFQRWPVLGQYVWPNSFIGQTYKQEVDFLKDWLYNRLLWLDFNYEDVSYIRPPQAPGQPPFQVYPNPARQYLHIKTTYDPRLLQEFSVQLYDANGRLAYHQPLLSGKSVITIELHEAGLSPGLYAYRIVDQLGKVWTGKVLAR